MKLAEGSWPTLRSLKGGIPRTLHLWDESAQLLALQDFHSSNVTSDLATYLYSAHHSRGGSSVGACTRRLVTPLRSRF
jgi:hypothetical protein